MNPTLFLAGTRIPRLLLFAAAPTVLALAVMFLPPKMSEGREGLIVSTSIFFLPVLWGWMLNSLVHEVLHLPFAMTMPRAARKILEGHALVTFIAAAGCGALAYGAVPGLPLVPLVALAAAAFVHSLPYAEGRNGWVFNVGSLAIVAVALSDVKIGLWVAGAIRRAPLLWTLGAGVFTVACFAETWTKHARRWRANTPYTSSFTALFSAPFTRRRSAQLQARKKASPQTWSTGASRDSTRWWLRVFQFERANEMGRAGWIGAIVAGVAGGVAVLWLGAAIDRQPGAVTGKILAGLLHHSSSMSGGLGMFLLIQPLLMAVPRHQVLYPFSRTRRLAMTCLGAVWQFIVGGTAMAAGVLFVVAVAAVVEGQPIPWRACLGFGAVVSTMLAFAPLVFWGRLRMELCDRRAPLALMLGCGMVFGPVTQRLIWGRPETWVLGAPPLDALAWSTGLIALSFLVGYVRLRRFFLHGDLLQR